MARRARQVARHSAPRLAVSVVHRPAGPRGHVRLWRRISSTARPDAVCAYDANPRELFPSLLARLRGVPVILEVGDLAAEQLAAHGARGPRLAYRKVVERTGWRGASVLTVRGPGFVPLLRERGVRRPVHVVPEGVDRSEFRPLDPRPGRALLGLHDGERAVGMAGSIIWNPVAGTAYGWELVDALPYLPGVWKAVVVGKGDGVARLRARASGLGVGGRLITPGAVGHDRMPSVLAALDAVTWTQTPDAVGSGRTTLKLPEYLACGKYVLASDVGQARRLIDANGVLLPYAGGRDPAYSRAVAETVASLPERDELDRLGAGGIERAAAFGWDAVAAAFCEAVELAVEGRR